MPSLIKLNFMYNYLALETTNGAVDLNGGSTFENGQTAPNVSPVINSGIDPNAAPDSFSAQSVDTSSNYDNGYRVNNTAANQTPTQGQPATPSGAASYTLLEPINGNKELSIAPSSFSTYLQSSFNVILGVMLVISVFRVMYGGAIFMTTDIVINKTKAKEIIINSLRGVFLAMITWGVLFFINPDTVNNNLGRIVLESGGKVVSGVGSVIGAAAGEVTGSGGVSGVACDSTAAAIEKVKAGQNMCSGQSCSKTCSFDASTASIIKDEASRANIDYRVLMAIACRESSGDINAVGNHAQNGYKDCGLMQINMKSFGTTSCTPEIMDIRRNVQEGIKLFKQKVGNTYTYANVSMTSQVFAAYNCCANGDNPNSTSVSCNSSTGFDKPIPKWACPIDPGSSAFNMCNVRNYACDVESCISKY